MDRMLVERAQHGDRLAFAQLAAASSDRLFAIALRIVRDFDLASDVLQMALLQIWRDLRSLRDPDRFEAWSYRVIVHVCQAELRRHRRRREASDLLASEAVVPDASISIAARDELDRAFARLTVHQRAILVLRYYGDQSIPEIAATLGVRPGTVKSRLHYAREAMRAAVEADARHVPQEGRLA